MGWRDAIIVFMLGIVGACSAHAQDTLRNRRMCVVLGAAGESQYGEAFRTWGSRWRQSADGFDLTMIDGASDEEPDPTSSHRETILRWIAEADAAPQAREHWLILIGHGTHDAKTTRFNLKGPDLSAVDLGKALKGRPGKWVVIVCASASAPFLPAVAGVDRVVITATKSGTEENYSRFGDFLSQSLSDEQADMDHDRSVSVLELFLAASRRVEKYYSEQGLLATEQALIDDNGDGRGTPAAFYRGVRAVKAPSEGAPLDGEFARRTVVSSQGASMDPENEEKIAAIESAIEELRRKKSDMDLDTYYQELEKLLVQLAGYLRVEQKP